MRLAPCLPLLLAALAGASETENQSIRVLPAPGPVAVDGAPGDWDLTGGIFACGEVEHLRDQYAVWLHAMHDAGNLYLLARWRDPTPLNNPEKAGGHGFNGDCLQVRFIMDRNGPGRTVTWWTLWRDARGASVADRAWPGPKNGVKDNELPQLDRAEEQGFRQAFAVDADGKGYTQEIQIPWKLLSAAGAAPAIGEGFGITVEPNFTAGSFGRITIKDLLEGKGHAPDRVFTFRAYHDWGTATLVAKGQVEPQPVRLADDRRFAVAAQAGALAPDWTGLIRRFEWPGFAPIAFDMPFDGSVSLNLVDREGAVVRHLLNGEARTKGRHTVMWDGLTDATYRTPGQPVPAGDYAWKAIAHPGARLSLRGHACTGGRNPWHGSPGDFWLGDHGMPSAALADGDRVFLACNGAEGGRHLIATDLEGRLQWGLQNTTGGADPEHIALADGTLYVLHPKYDWMQAPGTISRVDARTGSYQPWPGTASHIMAIPALWPAGQPATDHLNAIDARGGTLYATVGAPRIFVEDVADWPALVRAVRADNPLAKRIFAGIDPACCKRLDDFLAGKIDREKAFATWNGGPRFDREVVEELNKLLADAALTPQSAALGTVLRAQANRGHLEQALAPALRHQEDGRLAVIDAGTGKVTASWPLPLGGALKAADDHRVYVISGGAAVLAIDPATGATRTVVGGLSEARGLAIDGEGRLYISLGAPDMQVLVVDAQGREVKRIGKRGGHPRIGPWQPDGMIDPAGLAVDRAGQLWVTERYEHPKRVSVWKIADGTLVRDFLGPTQYGASGGAINPRDPDLMVGAGCEWRIDARTGLATCLGAFDSTYHAFATFREGANGRLYLYTTTSKYGTGAFQVWERLGDARYALRAELRNDLEPASDKNPGATELWIDRDGDGQRQPGEVQRRAGAFYPAGSNSWSLNLGPDLAFYGLDWSDKKLKALSADGFAAGGAPVYDLAKLRPMPDAMSIGYQRNASSALPSADNRAILLNLQVKDHPAGFLWHAFELASGRLLWTYPNPFFNVHGSHRAPAPDTGLFRGAFGPIGAVAAKGAGGFWIINGNLGEWNALTTDGFYLSRLFNGNVFDWKWPETAAPGTDMTNLPPGCGGEDFGGSATQMKDGRILLQAGKMSLWNVALDGLDATVAIPGGTVTVSAADTAKALALREQALQAAAGGRRLAVRRQTIAFTGNLHADFKGAQIIDYQKSDDARVRSAMAWDDAKLYIGWEVRDATPWVNGARDLSQMYACGDTVDLQLGCDPAAPAKRTAAAAGDLRLSIGRLEGKDTAVLYRFVSAEKKPRVFSSGVVQGWQVDWVDALAGATVQVKAGKEGYVVEAAIPLAALGLAPKPGLVLRGDLGATHADPSGVRTKLRTHWANQQTGLVDDVVFELKPTPQNWGELVFE